MAKNDETIATLMREKLKRQQNTEFLGNRIEDTKRCVFPDDKANIQIEKLTFAFVELLQNSADHMREVVEASAAMRNSRISDISFTENRIEFKFKGVTFLSVDLTDEGVVIWQIGRPLSLDATGTGTRSKREEINNTGGFGDGFKTAALYIAMFGAHLEFVFDHFGADVEGQELDARVTWICKPHIDDAYTEPHLCFLINTCKSGLSPQELPVMTTSVTAKEKCDVQMLHEAAVAALGRFEWLLYEIEDDAKVLSSENHGAWRRSRNFKPVVNSLRGYKIEMPSGLKCMAGGLFYQVPGDTIDLVVCLPGRCLPGDAWQVFNNQMREINFNHLRNCFARQFLYFHDSSNDNRAILCRAMQPLLKGGKSLLMNDGQRVGQLMQSILVHPYAFMIKSMLLFHKLQPREWSAAGADPTEAEKKELQRKVDNAVIVDSTTEQRARYIQFLCDNGGVVRVNTSVANTILFGPDNVECLQASAVRHLRTELCSKHSIAKKINSDLRPMIDYIASNNLHIIRVLRYAPEDIIPYTFRCNMESTIVFYQPVEDPVASIKELNSYYVNTKEEKERSTQFYMQFFSNALLTLCMKKRVKKAIKNAKKLVKFDIGDDAKKKRKLEDSDSDDSDSESSSAQMKKNANVPRPVVRKLVVATTSAVELAVPPLSKRKLRTGASGAAVSKERHANDQEGTCCMDQTFVDDLGIFVPDGLLFEPPNDMRALMHTFNEAKKLVRRSFHTGSAQVYASYSPDADWRGIHYGDGMCLINIALATSKEDMIGVLCHEISHEYIGPHDYRFVQYLQWHCTEVIKTLLSK